MPREPAPNGTSLPGHVLRTADLSGRSRVAFDVVPDAMAMAALATALGVTSVRKMRLTGTLRPEGARDWTLDARLGATVAQPCVVTLAAVTTRIDEPVTRRYMAAMAAPHPDPGAEVEMPEDVEVEPLGAAIDLGAVAAEALALAIPPFPRADGAALDAAVFAAPGVVPMRDEDARPFAGLADLARLRPTRDDDSADPAGGEAEPSED